MPSSVADVVAAYQRHAERTFRRPDGTPTRQHRNTALATRELVELYGDATANRLHSSQLKALRGLWVGRGLTRGTINARIGTIVRAWDWASEVGLVDEETATHLRTVRNLKRGAAAEGAGVECVPVATVLATLPHLGDHLADACRLMLLTGCRVGEAREARSDELDTRRGSLRPAWHKNAKHGIKREIVLNEPALAIVEARRHRTYIFGVNGGNKPYHRDAVTTAIYRACDRAGVPRWSPGQIRHTTATIVLGEHGLEAARALLGHSTDRCTRIYCGGGEGPKLRLAIKTLANVQAATA